MIVALNFIALPDTQAAGAFRYIDNILKMLQYYNLEDTHFILYKQKQIPNTFFEIPTNVDIEYIDVPTLGQGVKRILFEQTFFYKYLKKCDVFYSYCTSMPLLIHARKIFTLHDVYCFSDSHRHGLLKRLYLQWITRAYVLFADYILTVSTFSKQEIQHYLHIPDTKIRITYNFILPCDVNKNVNKNDNSTNKDRPYFLYVGSILPHKNIIGMIDGFISFNNANAFDLRIVGKCQDETIRAYMENKPNIYYLGFRTDEEINELYRNCISVVLLSFCEGFGIPPIEGFKYEKPALIANAASLPEVVGNAGVKVNPYSISEIAKGYQDIIDNSNSLKQHIPEQLAIFDPFNSCEHFMDALGINYKRL